MKNRLSFSVILIPFLLLASCQNLKQIPLFNNEASLINRIGSARELDIEVNGQVQEFRDKGWLTQEQIDKNFVPVILAAHNFINQADDLRKAGQNDQSANKLESAKNILLALRSQLVLLQKQKTRSS